MSRRMVRLPDEVEREFPNNIRRFREIYFKFMEGREDETKKESNFRPGTTDYAVSD